MNATSSTHSDYNGSDFQAQGQSGLGPVSVFGPSGPGLVSHRTSSEEDNIILERDPARVARMRRSVGVSVTLIEKQLEDLGVKYRAAMLTLTYRPGVDWSPRHISKFLSCFRAAMYPVPAAYVWVAEIQTRRAARDLTANCLHYHVIVWLPYRRGVEVPHADAMGWWPHGLTRGEWAYSPVGYLRKYVSKLGSFDRVPKGARISGVGGLTRKNRIERTYRMLPQWLKAKYTAADRIVRVLGGGWRSRLTGAYTASLWRVVARCAKWTWIRFEKVSPDDVAWQKKSTEQLTAWFLDREGVVA
jgi:hypothetical protein